MEDQIKYTYILALHTCTPGTCKYTLTLITSYFFVFGFNKHVSLQVLLGKVTYTTLVCSILHLFVSAVNTKFVVLKTHTYTRIL